MTNESTWQSVDDFLESQFGLGDEALEHALQSSADAGMPSIAVSPCQGALLNLLARSIGAKRILEIGTLGGYSTIWLARGLADGGELVTLELNPEHARVARSNLEFAGLSEGVEIMVGPAMESLALLAERGDTPFDLSFIDADKANLPGYFDWALKLSRPGSLIIVDNVVRNGAVTDSESDDPSVRGVRAMLEIAAAEPRVSGTAIQTVGAKGYDGFAVYRVDR